jgi:predicted Zn finger-like uncharacterized protein
MIISCPSCNAQYDLPEGAIGPKGRRVKCTSCSYTWLQAPAGEESFEIIQEQITENFTTESKSKETTPPRAKVTQAVPVVKDVSARWIAGISFATSLLLIVLSILFLLFTRQGMTASWPPLALFYQALGVEVPVPGAELQLADIESKMMEDGTLWIKGKIQNNTKTDQVLAGLLIRVDGAKGWLKDWPVDLNNKVFRPKEEIPFEYRLQDVPTGVENVTIRFSE